MAGWSPVQRGYLAISLLAILLNSAVIFLFLTKKKLRKMHSNLFLFSLAISDLCYASVAMPLLIRCEQFHDLNDLCLAYGYVMVFFGYSTVYHIMLGIAEKLYAICFTLKHHSKFCRSIAIKLSLSVWLLSIFLAHIPVWWEYILKPPNANGTDEEARILTYQAYYKFHFAIGFALPVLMSAIMYSVIFHKIFKVVHRRLSEDTKKNKTRLRAEKKAAFTFAVMQLAFLFSWGGWFLARVGAITVDDDDVSTYYDFVTISRFLDPIFNPLLYTFLKNDFRKAFLGVIRGTQRGQGSGMHLTRLNHQATTSGTHEDMLQTSPAIRRHETSMKQNHHQNHHHNSAPLLDKCYEGQFVREHAGL